MKKICLVVIIGLLSGTVVFADHAQESLAVGGVFGVGLAGNGPDLYCDFYPMSLSIHIPKVPLMWGLHWKIPFGHGFGMGLTGDWYFAEPNLVEKTTTNKDGTYELKIDWYVGLGFYGEIYGMLGIVAGAGGLRIPFGVSFHVMEQIKQLEVSVGSVAGVGVGGASFWGLRSKPYCHWFFTPLEVGVRWWFD